MRRSEKLIKNVNIDVNVLQREIHSACGRSVGVTVMTDEILAGGCGRGPAEVSVKLWPHVFPVL